MKTFSTVVLLIALTGTPILAQRKAAAPRLTALRLLKVREPAVKWNPQSILTGDFDYDNILDYALAGRKGVSFVVGIVKGRLNRKSKHSALEFSDGSSQNDLCSTTSAEIGLETFAANDEIEELRNLPKNSRGINLADGLCDAFHIYYSKSEKRFVWRRN